MYVMTFSSNSYSKSKLHRESFTLASGDGDGDQENSYVVAFSERKPTSGWAIL